MVRATVTFALLFFSCTYAAPAPRVIEVTLLRDSIVGFDLGAGNIQAKDVQGDRHLHVDIPDEAAGKTPENVNSDTGVASGVNINVDKILSVAESLKDKILPGK